MLKKGKEVTLRKFYNIITDKESVLLGARYTSSIMTTDIPITTTFEDVEVDLKKETVAGTISFRPVGERQINALSLLKEASTAYGGYGEFLDDTIEKPLINSDFAVDVSLADSAFSNLQEIPFNLYMSSPKVFYTEVSIRGRKHMQYGLEDESSSGVTSMLALVFRKKLYDGETLLGVHTYTEALARVEGIKVLQFIANGSVLEQVIGAVSVLGGSTGTTLFPMFDDMVMQFVMIESVPWVHISCDTGAIAFKEEDIRNVTIKSARPGEYKVTIYLLDEKVTLLIG